MPKSILILQYLIQVIIFTKWSLYLKKYFMKKDFKLVVFGTAELHFLKVESALIWAHLSIVHFSGKSIPTIFLFI